MVELADARDSKSRVREDVRVQVPPPAPWESERPAPQSARLAFFITNVTMRYLLDTDVLSDPLSPAPDRKLTATLRKHNDREVSRFGRRDDIDNTALRRESRILARRRTRAAGTGRQSAVLRRWPDRGNRRRPRTDAGNPERLRFHEFQEAARRKLVRVKVRLCPIVSGSVRYWPARKRTPESHPFIPTVPT